MMKNLFFIYAIFCFFAATAQEQLTPLSSNAALYYSTRPYQPTVQNQRGAWIEPNNYLIVADTIDLPFVDDFSTNKSRPFNFEQNNITATIINSFGACDSPAMKVTTILGRFHKVQTYTYTYNLTTHSIDSTPNAPIPFKKYNNTDCNCFFAPASPITLYPEFFDRTFDTLRTGLFLQKIFLPTLHILTHFWSMRH